MSDAVNEWVASLVIRVFGVQRVNGLMDGFHDCSMIPAFGENCRGWLWAACYCSHVPEGRVPDIKLRWPPHRLCYGIETSIPSNSLLL